VVWCGYAKCRTCCLYSYSHTTNARGWSNMLACWALIHTWCWVRSPGSPPEKLAAGVFSKSSLQARRSVYSLDRNSLTQTCTQLSTSHNCLRCRCVPDTQQFLLVRMPRSIPARVPTATGTLPYLVGLQLPLPAGA
jgi:hypothetical protein